MRVSIFPLPGAVLFPGLHLPLHIFEPRYRAMVSDALARDRLIGMVQPQVAHGTEHAEDGAPLYAVGCLGHIDEVEALPDGRYNIVLRGRSRFRIAQELAVSTPFRQVEAAILDNDGAQVLSAVERALFEREARRFAEIHGYRINWDEVSRLDDAGLINGVAQIGPFDPAAKQALLEADGVPERCELLVQLMQFFARHDGDDTLPTLQ